MKTSGTKGKLILIVGLSGSGKSTLVTGALQAIPKLQYLKTYTTRPMREGEEISHEFTFLDQAAYDELRAQSAHWDHTEYGGFSYGADVAGIFARLKKGQNIICSVIPHPKIISDVTRIYGAETIVILINTPREVAESRIAGDKIRRLRKESLDGIHFDVVFEPTGKLETDTLRFNELLVAVLAA